MPHTSMIGSRIRERRVLSGIRQSELAKRAGISPSYLNLIEHNRRRIGGKTLLQLAEALEVEPSWLSEGAGATLIQGLREAAGMQTNHSAELERTEEFAGRFPGWAELLSETARRNQTLEQTVQTLTDRLAHDPQLAASLHEVISTVTAIRSTASILADTKELEPAWRARFDRNINEDSARLAEGAEALVRYLEDAPDQNSEVLSPQDELQAFLTKHGYHFDALEEGDIAPITVLIESAEMLVSETARALAHAHLFQYSEDARSLSAARLIAEISDHGLKPDLLLEALDVSPGCLFRRLASLPENVVGPVGLVGCDASGSLIYRKPLSSFSLPGSAGACPLWPLFQVLGQLNTPIRTVLVQAGRSQEQVQSYALAEQVSAVRFDEPTRIAAYMLFLPLAPEQRGSFAREVGTTCRICARTECSARRERSIVSKGF